MSSKANVTTPGGFFVGLGGIVSFCVVAAGVYCWVKSPSSSKELQPQQVALGLRPGQDAKTDDIAKIEKETKSLLTSAAAKYNAGAAPDIDKLDDLRGLIRFREANKSKTEADKSLAGAVAWKDKAKGEVTMPIELAMKTVAGGLKERKPKASAVKVDPVLVLDPNAAPMMPNAMGGGAKTVIFADPNPPAPAATPAPAPSAATPANPPAAVPAPAPAPATPAAAPAPAAPAPQLSAPSSGGASTASPQPAVATTAAGRPTLLNWPESKK